MGKLILEFAVNYKLTAAWITLGLAAAILSIFSEDASMVPVGLMLLLYMISPFVVARRRGKNPWKWAFLCSFMPFPCWIILVASKKLKTPARKAPQKKPSKSQREIDQEYVGKFDNIINLNIRQKKLLKDKYGSIRRLRKATREDLEELGFTDRQINAITSH
jgi:hypothetical protein